MRGYWVCTQSKETSLVNSAYITYHRYGKVANGEYDYYEYSFNSDSNGNISGNSPSGSSSSNVRPVVYLKSNVKLSYDSVSGEYTILGY